MNPENQERKLLRKAIKLFSRLINTDCGNCEGTPCNDSQPYYVCPGHLWLKEAKKLEEEQ
jgi:hypothetical protein